MSLRTCTGERALETGPAPSSASVRRTWLASTVTMELMRPSCLADRRSVPSALRAAWTVRGFKPRTVSDDIIRSTSLVASSGSGRDPTSGFT
jgi:hypothetical protein